jgi:hypothetical protein
MRAILAGLVNVLTGGRSAGKGYEPKNFQKITKEVFEKEGLGGDGNVDPNGFADLMANTNDS